MEKGNKKAKFKLDTDIIPDRVGISTELVSLRLCGLLSESTPSDQVRYIQVHPVPIRGQVQVGRWVCTVQYRAIGQPDKRKHEEKTET